MQLTGFDLNLLVALRALVETQSIKEAAKRLSLSPSATSHALARLRDAFGDELLVRAGRQMVPTPKALQLQAPLREVLEGAEGLFRANALEVDRLARAFSFATNDFVELVILPEWSRVVRRLAPQVDLLSRPVGDDAIAALRAGEVDLGLGVFADAALPEDIRREPVLESRFVVLLREGHPALARRLTPKRYAELEHVLVAPRGRGPGIVDRTLADLGLERRVARVVANFSAAPRLIERSDYVVTISAHIAALYAERSRLRIVAPPVSIPSFTVSTIWHRRNDAEPELAWLRRTLRTSAAALEKTPGSGRTK